MKKFVLAPAVAALAMFLFGAAYWISPFPYKVLTPVGDNAAAAETLARIFPATGTYLIPGPEIQDQQLLADLYQRGPSAQVQFIKEGHAPMEPAVFVKGFLHYFVVALLLALLISRTGDSVRTCYACIIKLSALVGVIGAVLIHFSDPIWWHHPWAWHLVCAAYVVLEMTLAGAVLGRFFVSANREPSAV